MDSKQRWKIAQKSEQRYWAEDAEKRFIQDERKMLYYKDRAILLNRWIETVTTIRKPFGRILEIGSGPLGVCGFFEAEEKHAIDPLEDFYLTRPGLIRFRDENVKYMNGNAEKLPYKDRFFDFVIMDNTLDHTILPRDVLSEVYRVMKESGHFYVLLHVYTRYAANVRWVLEKTIRVDKGHPHIFRKKSIRNCLAESRFMVVKEECETTLQVRRRLLLNSYWRRRLYSFLGLAGMEYMAICCKH